MLVLSPYKKKNAILQPHTGSTWHHSRAKNKKWLVTNWIYCRSNRLWISHTLYRLRKHRPATILALNTCDVASMEDKASIVTWMVLSVKTTNGWSPIYCRSNRLWISHTLYRLRKHRPATILALNTCDVASTEDKVSIVTWMVLSVLWWMSLPAVIVRKLRLYTSFKLKSDNFSKTVHDPLFGKPIHDLNIWNCTENLLNGKAVYCQLTKVSTPISDTEHENEMQ